MKAGKAKVAGSGFGGKGLDRLDQERDAKEKAERKAYGEPEDEKPEEAAKTQQQQQPTDDMTFGTFKVEVKRGPAPDSSKGLLGVAGAAAAARRLAQAKEEEKLQSSLRAAEDAVARAGKDTPAAKQASSVVAKLNAQLRAHKLVAASQSQLHEELSRKSAVDASEFHAIIPINDYPQKARWRVTNKETMVQLIDMTGASVTNKGVSAFRLFSRPGTDRLCRYLLRSGERTPCGRSTQTALAHRVERGVEGESSVDAHSVSQSDFILQVEQAVREIKRLLIEASAAALQAEMRNPTATAGRYSVV